MVGVKVGVTFVGLKMVDIKVMGNTHWVYRWRV